MQSLYSLIYRGWSYSFQNVIFSRRLYIKKKMLFCAGIFPLSDMYKLIGCLNKNCEVQKRKEKKNQIFLFPQ